MGLALGGTMVWLLDRFLRNQEFLTVTKSSLPGETATSPMPTSADGLTEAGLSQIPNGSHFHEFIEQEWQRGARQQKPICVIFCDIDYFKEFNDHYGPMEGDQCLLHVAQSLRRAARRAGDLVVRYGGHEFAMVLPNTPLGGGVFVAREVQNQMQRLQMANIMSLVNPCVSVSLGVASRMPTADTQPDILIAEASRQLVHAQQQGRNRIACEVEALLRQTQAATLLPLRVTDATMTTSIDTAC
jgi:diguanylate cyclase (GGDEF)-like protein